MLSTQGERKGRYSEKRIGIDYLYPPAALLMYLRLAAKTIGHRGMSPTQRLTPNIKPLAVGSTFRFSRKGKVSL